MNCDVLTAILYIGHRDAGNARTIRDHPLSHGLEESIVLQFIAKSHIHGRGKQRAREKVSIARHALQISIDTFFCQYKYEECS